MSELELQVLEKKARQEREKREQDELEARKAREAAEYDYFSRRGGGGGAPMRDADGNVRKLALVCCCLLFNELDLSGQIITSRKALVSTPTRPATNSSSFDARAEVSAYSARITTPASPPVSSGAKSEYLR